MKRIITLIFLFSTFLYGEIKIGLVPREDKYYFTGEDGEVEGKIKEFFEYIKREEGLEYRLILLSYTDMKLSLENDEIDYAFIFTPNDYTEKRLYTDSFGQGRYYFYSSKEGLNNFSKLGGSTIGVEAYDPLVSTLSQRIKLVGAEFFPLINSREKLLFWNNNIVDGIFTNIEDLDKVYKGFVKSKFPTPYTGEYRFYSKDIRKRNILNTYLKKFMSDEYLSVVERIEHEYIVSRMALSEREKKYIEDNKSIKVAINKKNKPFEYYDESGEFSGLIAEFLSEVAYITGLNFEYEGQDYDVRVLRDKLVSNEIQLIPFATDRVIDIPQMYISEEIIPLKLASAVKSDYLEGTSLIDLEGKKIGIKPNYYLENFLKTALVNVEIVFVETINQGLKWTEEGKVDIYFDSYFALNNQLIANPNLKVRFGNVYENQYGLRFVVNDSNREFVNIINKAINIIDTQELVARWTTNVEVKESYKVVERKFPWFVHIVSIFFLIALAFYLYLLKEKNESIEKIYLELIDYSYSQISYEEKESFEREEKILRKLCSFKKIKNDKVREIIIGNKVKNVKEVPMAKLSIHINEGYNWAKERNLTITIENIIRYHHERWDGTGTARGLRGEEIPLEARLVSFVTYLSKINKIDIGDLRSRSGSEFDPQLVEIFLNNLDKFDIKE